MKSFRDYLVFDRTQQDVNEQNEKGTYNIADLNRVMRAYCYLATLLHELGYEVPTPWYPAYLICTEISPNGSGDAGGGIFYRGETVELTAAPFSGFAFAFWEENGTAVNYEETYRFTADRSRTLTAVFAADGSKDLGVVGYGTIGRAQIGKRWM